MGLDLRLLPVECDHPEWGFSHSILGNWVAWDGSSPIE